MGFSYVDLGIYLYLLVKGVVIFFNYRVYRYILLIFELLKDCEV